MNNKEYLVFESAAGPSMQEAVALLRSELIALGHLCSEPSQVDNDFERGFGFEITHPAALAPIGLQFILTDIERGFERPDGKPECGLLLSVVAPDGALLGDWSPSNYTEEAGTPDPVEVVRRVGLLEATGLSASIHARITSWAEAQRESGEAPRA